jgi:hypothetical protein
MGTNYYLERNVCAHCGRGDEALHIGKSSAGWCFSLRVHPEEGIHDLPDWEREFVGGKVRDEYGETIGLADLRGIICNRTGRPFDDAHSFLGYSCEAEFHRMNFSERGPKGLLRHRIDSGSRCIGHGAGTWDLIDAEFS